MIADADLTTAEVALVRSAAEGLVEDYTTEAVKVVRAAVVRELLVGERPCHANGVRLKGALVTGSLRCENTELAALVAEHCKFDEPIIILRARVPVLALTGSSVPSLFGDGLAAGDLYLNSGFRTVGEVRIAGARISGLLNLSGAQLRNDNGTVLFADGIRVSHSVYMRDGFSAVGTVRMRGAKVEGNLECDGAAIVGANGQALVADQLELGGALFLRNGFTAKGEVRLVSARIGTDLDCSRGTFENSRGRCINADALAINGRLFMRNLAAPMVGTLDLTAAKVGSLIDDPSAWPSPAHLILDGLRYDRITGEGVPVTAALRRNWLSRQRPRPFLPQPHRQLATVMRAMGRDDDARKIDVARHRAMRERGFLSPTERAWSHFHEMTTGFGYEPWWLLVPLCAAILYGYIAASIGLAVGAFAPASTTVTASSPAPFLYSLDTLLPIFNLGQADQWMIEGRSWPSMCLSAYFLIHQLAGAYVAIMGTAAITGLLRKD